MRKYRRKYNQDPIIIVNGLIKCFFGYVFLLVDRELLIFKTLNVKT